MEERRLKTILAHLSNTSSQMGKPCVFNATSKAEKHCEFLPGSMHLQHKKHIVHASLSRSRSSSDVMESRLVGFAEESPASENAWHAVPPEVLLSHGHGAVSPSKYERKLPKSHTSEESEDSLCLCSRDVRKTHTQEYSLETTEFGSMQRKSSNCFHHDCSSSGAAKFEWTLQCKSSYFKDKQAAALEGKQIDSRCSTPLDQQVSKHQSQALKSLPLSSEGDHYRSRTSDSLGNTEEIGIQSFRNLHTLDSQSAEIENDAAGSISRNNVMTGQRRRIAEDCVFCLIIQGQSPAFKLYEDDMCVCILDVHPLSHGHSLLIPKTHFPSLELTPPEVAAAMCATVPLISMAVMQATNCDSFNLLVNSGKAAGQVVFHTHFHIIPRRMGDNLWRSEDGNRRALPVGHETALLVQQIRHNLSNKSL
ncbi:hypothetical protein L7F22_020977 [Adiantum nelumboides]|nr:hypothetical protein [Adiantum nelumboides]